MDIFYLSDCLGENFMFLGVLCDASLLHVVGMPASGSSSSIWSEVETCWLTPFGPMDELVVDAEKGFLSQEFIDLSVRAGIDVRKIAEEAHWQLGRLERHDFTVKTIIANAYHL